MRYPLVSLAFEALRKILETERMATLKEFYIKSYYAASYLLSNGISPLRIEFTPKRYRIFFYADTEETQNLLNSFYANPEMQSFVSGCVALKRKMYDK